MNEPTDASASEAEGEAEAAPASVTSSVLAELERLLTGRRMKVARTILWLPVGIFLAGSLVAFVSSPVLRADSTPDVSRRATTGQPLPPVTLPPPVGQVRIGSWDGEPLCRDDPTGDVERQPVSGPGAVDPSQPEQVGGPGDLTSVCARYSATLAIEARMDQPVDQQADDRDDATLQIHIDVNQDERPDYGITVERRGPATVATVEANATLTSVCAGAAAWRNSAVRVEIDPQCLMELPRLGMYVSLRHYDTDDFVDLADAVPGEDMDTFSYDDLQIPRTDPPG